MHLKLIILAMVLSSPLFASWEVKKSFYEVPITTDKQVIQKALFNDVNTRNYLLSYDLTEFSNVKVISYQMLVETVEWHDDEECRVESPVKITNMVVNVKVEFMLSGFDEIKTYNYKSQLNSPCNDKFKVNI